MDLKTYAESLGVTLPEAESTKPRARKAPEQPKPFEPSEVGSAYVERLKAHRSDGLWQSADKWGRWADHRGRLAYDDRRWLLVPSDLPAPEVLGLGSEDLSDLLPRERSRKPYVRRWYAIFDCVKHPKPSDLGRLNYWPGIGWGRYAGVGIQGRNPYAKKYAKEPKPKAPKVVKQPKPEVVVPPEARADGLVTMTRERTLELLRLAGQGLSAYTVVSE